MEYEQEIAIVVKEDGKNSRVSIHPEISLMHFQRVYGNQLIDYYLVDEKGERIKGNVVPTKTKQEKAFEGLKQIAKELKIKGWHLMSEDTLEKAVQQASKNK